MWLAGCTLILQEDGNLVLYRTNVDRDGGVGSVMWTSNTHIAQSDNTGGRSEAGKSHDCFLFLNNEGRLLLHRGEDPRSIAEDVPTSTRVTVT